MKSTFSGTGKQVHIPLKKSNFQYLSTHSFLRSLSKTIKFAGMNNDGRLLSSVFKGECCASEVALAEPVNQYLLH